MERLQRDGLVETEPYRSIELTRAGRRMAAASRERHAQVLALLLSLGIEPEVAEQDAEGIEHHVGPETRVAFERFVAARGGAEGAPTPAASDPERFARSAGPRVRGHGGLRRGDRRPHAESARPAWATSPAASA